MKELKLIVFKLAALQAAKCSTVLVTLSQLEKDSLDLAAYTTRPRAELISALHKLEIREYFDFLIYQEVLREMSADELRKLADPAVMFVDDPANVNYKFFHELLPERQRPIPAWALT